MKDESYDQVLERVQIDYREGDLDSDGNRIYLDEDKITSWVMGAKGSEGKRQEFANKLFQIYIEKANKRFDEEAEEKKTIAVARYDGVQMYKRSFMSWKANPSQEQFIKDRIRTKTTREIIYEYNATFSPMKQERSASSIKSKVYRLRK